MSGDNNRKVRGQSFDTDLIRNMMRDGFSTKEIAAELGTDSTQSVRNAMRAIRKSLESNKIKKDDKERKKKMPAEVGIIPCAMDNEVASAMESILEIYSSGGLTVPTIMSGTEGKVIIINDQSNYHSIKKFMDMLGFYGELCSNDHRVDIVKIEFPGSAFDNLDKSFLSEGIITIESGHEERIQFDKIIKPYVESNDLHYVNINNMGFTDSCSVEIYASLKKKLADSGLHFHIKYDPLHIFPPEKYYLIDSKEQKLVFAPLDYMVKMDEVSPEIKIEMDARINEKILRSYGLLQFSNIDIHSLREKYKEALIPTMLERFEEKLGFIEIPYVSNDKIEREIKNRIDIHNEALKKQSDQTPIKENADPIQELADLQLQKAIKNAELGIRKAKKDVLNAIKLYTNSQKGISKQRPD